MQKYVTDKKFSSSFILENFNGSWFQIWNCTNIHSLLIATSESHNPQLQFLSTKYHLELTNELLSLPTRSTWPKIGEVTCYLISWISCVLIKKVLHLRRGGDVDCRKQPSWRSVIPVKRWNCVTVDYWIRKLARAIRPNTGYRYYPERS